MIARDLGMEVKTVLFQGSDPVAYLCAQGLHERQISQSLKALIVVSMCQWAPRGRPGKSTVCVDFPDDACANRTLKVMAEMAGVGTTSISQAKVVFLFGLAEKVLAGKLRFLDAYRRARLVSDAGAGEAVLSGEVSFDAAYRQALSKGPPTSRTETSQHPSSKDLTEQVKVLESSNADLRKEIQLLQVENERQRSAALASKVALERERNRADTAEAKVAKLRLRLDQSRC